MEYKKRIENEAKQKHLAKLNNKKKSNQVSGEKAADGLHDAYLEVGDRDVQEHLALGNKVTNNLNSIPMSTVDGSAMPVTSSTFGTHAKFKQGLYNGAVREDGLFLVIDG